MPSATRRATAQPLELLQGTLDLLILETLRGGPLHGYGIVQMIRVRSDSALQVETGSLYPALHRLEKQDWIVAAWGVSDQKRRVRLYRLTPRGRRQLTAERSRWARLSAAIVGVLHRPATA